MIGITFASRGLRTRATRAPHPLYQACDAARRWNKTHKLSSPKGSRSPSPNTKSARSLKPEV